MCELLLRKVYEVLWGKTTAPGVALFKKFSKEFHSIDIDYENLCTFDIDFLPEWLQDEAFEVLSWAENVYQQQTFPRGDYRELLELLIVYLGGEKNGNDPKIG